MLIYKTIFSKKAKRDLIRIAKFMENYNSNKIIERIYKSIENEIIILRIFNQKENYLNQRKFILREKSQKYLMKI